MASSPLLVGMHPNVRHGLPFLNQSDYRRVRNIPSGASGISAARTWSPDRFPGPIIMDA
jgi:hypothetical protein